MAPLARTGAGNVTSSNNASTTSLTITKPSNTADGDLLIAVIYQRNTSATLSGPAGWSWAKQENGNGTFGIAYKAIPTAASETATNYTFSTSAGANRMVGGIIRVTGADLTTPIDATGATSVFTGTSSLVMPSVTAATSGCLLLALETNNAGATVATFTADAAMGGVTQLSVTDGTSTCNIQVAQQQLTQSGATGTRTATMSPSANNSAGFMITIKSGIVVTPVSGTDSGTLTEGTSTLTATVPTTDAGTLTETRSISATSATSDSGTLAEAAIRVVIGEPTFSLAIDWAGDGDFTDPGDDITDRVLASGGLNAQYGRDQARSLSPPAAGQAAWMISNLSGDYSPDRTDSPLAGDILPARAVWATVGLNGVTYTLFRGHLDQYQINVDHMNSTVSATALDGLADLKGVKVSTILYQGLRTGTAIGHLLDAVGWPADKRDLDPGGTFIRWWWMNNDDAWDMLTKLVSSEGPGAIIHAGPDGEIVFRDRHHRLLESASTTVQANLTDGADGHEPAFSQISYDHGWADIVNQVSFTVDELNPGPDVEEVWSSQDVYQIDPNQTLTIVAQTNDPIVLFSVSPSYTAVGTVTASWTLTNAQMVTLTFTAGASGAQISELVVSGRAVAKRRSYTIEASDAASIAKYGARSPTSTIEVPWAGVHDAAAIADLIIAARAERLPTVQITILGVRNNARLVQQVGRDLSDRVHIVERVTGLDHDFFIEQIQHRVTEGGNLTTTFGMERAVKQATNVFRFDDPAHGFDNGVFGSAGLDDPETIFVFNDANRGFDNGVFAS